METFPQDYPSHTSFEPAASAAIAALVIFGLLWGLVELSRTRGETAERFAAAQRTCAHLTHQRDREICVKQLLNPGRAHED